MNSSIEVVNNASVTSEPHSLNHPHPTICKKIGCAFDMHTLVNRRVASYAICHLTVDATILLVDRV
jgi:hypothetical protein